MAKFKYINSFDDEVNRLHDNYTSLGYKFEHNIFKNVLSKELFMNPATDTPYRQLERMIEHLVNEVKLIKLAYAFALPKHSKNIN